MDDVQYRIRRSGDSNWSDWVDLKQHVVSDTVSELVWTLGRATIQFRQKPPFRPGYYVRKDNNGLDRVLNGPHLEADCYYVFWFNHQPSGEYQRVELTPVD